MGTAVGEDHSSLSKRSIHEACAPPLSARRISLGLAGISAGTSLDLAGGSAISSSTAPTFLRRGALGGARVGVAARMRSLAALAALAALADRVGEGASHAGGTRALRSLRAGEGVSEGGARLASPRWRGSPAWVRGWG